jgi:hypothetical protein
MERWMSGTGVVIIWAGFNTVLASILAGFTASGVVGGAGTAGALAFSMYAVAAALVFLIALANWWRTHRVHGLRVPPRPATALLLALGIALIWVGLAYGPWVCMLAAAPLLAALVLELYPRERP